MKLSQGSLKGILQVFIVNRNDPRICPDLCKAVGSIASLLTPHLPLLFTALALETRSAWGYTDVLATPPSLDCVHVLIFVSVIVCVCVSVCVCVTRCLSLPLTKLHCNHCTQLPPAFSSSVPSCAIKSMISTLDPNVSGHD